MSDKKKKDNPFNMDEISEMAPETKKSISEKLGKIIRETLDEPEKGRS